MKIKENIIVIIILGLLIAASIAFVFGGSFFVLKGFFTLIGVTYESSGALLLFVFYCFLIGLVFEIIEGILLFFISRMKLLKQEKWIWIVIVKYGLTWLVIHIVNDWMTTVDLSIFAEILTAFLIVMVELVFDDDHEKEVDIYEK